MQFSVSDAVNFQPELLYVARGVKESVQRNTSTWDNGAMTTVREEGEAKIRTSYLELPLLFGMSMAQGFRLQVGPLLAFRTSYSYALKSSRTITANGSTSTQAYSEEGDDDSNMEEMDYGVALGLNYEGKSGLNIGARYVRGLASLAKVSPEPIKYNGIQVSVGYTIQGK